MSKKSEKYARMMDKRVNKLEERMDELEEQRLNDSQIALLQYQRDVAEANHVRLRNRISSLYNELSDLESRILYYKASALLMGVVVLCTILISIATSVRAAEPVDSQAAIVMPEASENELIESALLARAHRLGQCTVTHYDVCEACCGKADGITASGVQATPYISCAVDPSVIPLGSDVLVDYGDGEIHYYRADDTGSGVTGNTIDLCVESHEEAVQLGVRTADVYWCEG